MPMGRGQQRADAIDAAVDSIQKNGSAKTPWQRAGMTEAEYMQGKAQQQQELDLERMRKNQSHPGNH